MKAHTTEVKGQSAKPTDTQKSKELKTDSPLSEKDEVKKAEARTRKELRHHL